MKQSFARPLSAIAIVGSLAVLIGFLILPFALHPVYLRTTTGLELIKLYMRLLSYPAPANLRVYSIITSLALWYIPISAGLSMVLAIVAFFVRKHFVLALSILLLSFFGLIALFLDFYDYTASGANILALMFPARATPFGPLISFGWWISLIGFLLTLIVSLIALIRSRQPARIYRDFNPGMPYAQTPSRPPEGRLE